MSSWGWPEAAPPKANDPLLPALPLVGLPLRPSTGAGRRPPLTAGPSLPELHPVGLPTLGCPSGSEGNCRGSRLSETPPPADTGRCPSQALLGGCSLNSTVKAPPMVLGYLVVTVFVAPGKASKQNTGSASPGAWNPHQKVPPESCAEKNQGPPILNKGPRTIQWGKSIFNKWRWERETPTCKRMKLDPYLIPYRKTKSQWIKYESPNHKTLRRKHG